MLGSLASGKLTILDRFSVSIQEQSFACFLTSDAQPGERFNVVKKSQEVIRRVAGRLIQEKKKKIEEAEKAGTTYGGKDLLSALRQSKPSGIDGGADRIY